MKRKVIHPMGPQNTQSQPYLVHKNTRETVKIGETLTDFRGDKAKLESIELPRHGGSTGRVYVNNGKWTHGYYPGVFDLVWVGRTDQD